MIDLANNLAKRDIPTLLITGRLIARNNTLHKSVLIKKIIKYSRHSRIRRLVRWIVAFAQIIFLIKTKYRKDYLFIFTNPPFNTFLPIFCKNRFSLMVYDVYPDALTQMGLFHHNSFIVHCWQKVNRNVFLRADSVFTLTENMATRLEQYISRERITIAPVWSDNEFFKPLKKSQNPFVAEYNLENRFVVLYSGNLGATHNVEIIPQLASAVQNPNIVFLIIGDGDRLKWLEEAISRRNLKNCLLLPLQPVSKIPYSFASADLSIVSVNEEASGLSLPSKTFNFMSAGLPLLCIAGNDSELNSLTRKYNNGKCFMPNQIDEIVTFINELSENRSLRDDYGDNSLKASRDFTPQNVEVITRVIENSFKTN